MSGDVVLRCAADDGLYLPTIKRHSLEKIALHNRYASIFGTGMKNQWPQRAYVGLYCGAGRALVKTPHGTLREIVETSALAVLRQPDPFTHYVYVDHDERCTTALGARIASVRPDAEITIIQADVNDCVPKVRAALPQFRRDRGLLSFCFMDPFSLQLKFSTIRGLADLRMDILILLMVAVDGRRNLSTYLRDEASTRIGDFIDCPEWRSLYRDSGHPNIVQFLTKKFDDAMVRVGYRSASEDLNHPIKVYGKGVLQYVLAFYSKNKKGQDFWRASRASLDLQIGLNFG